MDIDTKYQFIVDKHGKPKAIEILFDAENSSLDTSVFSLNVIDSICLREHAVNLLNFFEEKPFLKEKVKDIYLHLNIFPRTVLVEDILTDRYFISLLKSLPFKNIVLEVIERGFELSPSVFDENMLRKTLEKIKKVDFLVAIDDFGNGFMSHNVLQFNDLFDIVKVDYVVFSQDTEYLLRLTQRLKELGKTVILEKKFLPEHSYIDLFQTYEVHYPQPLFGLEKELGG